MAIPSEKRMTTIEMTNILWNSGKSVVVETACLVFNNKAVYEMKVELIRNVYKTTATFCTWFCQWR